MTKNAKSVNVFSRIGLLSQAQDKEQQYYKGTNIEFDMTKGIMTKENWLKLRDSDQAALLDSSKKCKTYYNK